MSEQRKKNKREKLKYHPTRVQIMLAGCGLIAFCAIVVGMVALVEWVGDACNLENSLDLLGGAIGILLGFIADKFCIDRITHIQKYKMLMKAINHEFDIDTQKLNILLITTKDEIEVFNKNTQNKEKIKIEKIINNVETLEELSVDIRQKINEVLIQSPPNGLTWEKYILQKKPHWYVPSVRQWIVDDVVTNSETVAIITNIPFAKQEFKNELVDRLRKIYKKIEHFNAYWNSLVKEENNNDTEKNYEKIIKMVTLRNELKNLIKEHKSQCGVKDTGEELCASTES